MSGKTLKYKQAQNTNTFYRLIAIFVFVIIVIFIVSPSSSLSSSSSTLIRGSTSFIKDLEDSGIQKFNQYTGRLSTTSSITTSSSSKKKKKVAYAITVTKDGHFVDGALVLGHSAKRVHDISKGFHSEYDADLVAFVVPGVKYARPGNYVVVFYDVM